MQHEIINGLSFIALLVATLSLYRHAKRAEEDKGRWQRLANNWESALIKTLAENIELREDRENLQCSLDKLSKAVAASDKSQAAYINGLLAGRDCDRAMIAHYDDKLAESAKDNNLLRAARDTARADLSSLRDAIDQAGFYVQFYHVVTADQDGRNRKQCIEFYLEPKAPVESPKTKRAPRAKRAKSS